MGIKWSQGSKHLANTYSLSRNGKIAGAVWQDESKRWMYKYARENGDWSNCYYAANLKSAKNLCALMLPAES